MKIAPTSVENLSATAQSGSKEKTKQTSTTTAPSAPAPSVDDLTQSSLHAAQQALQDEPQSDVDMESVSQMQADIAEGRFTVNNDELAASMLSFFN